MALDSRHDRLLDELRKQREEPEEQMNRVADDVGPYEGNRAATDTPSTTDTTNTTLKATTPQPATEERAHGVDKDRILAGDGS